MKQIKIEKFEVIHMNNKSLSLRINDSIEAYASKRVANEIFVGITEFVFIDERTFESGKTNNWLATPTIF